MESIDKVIISLFCIILIYIVFLMNTTQTETLTIGMWNLQVFGSAKAANDSLMQVYLNRIESYDFFILQEIRAINNSPYEKFCSSKNCILSARAGRSTSKEQYGILYEDSINILNTTDYTNVSDCWERPPYYIEIYVENINGNRPIHIYTIHTKPTDVEAELICLEKLVEEKHKTEDSIIIIGDLNADCNYFKNDGSIFGIGWDWIIEDSEDTTTSNTDCAYDRIIVKNIDVIDYRIIPSLPEWSDHAQIELKIR